ncbi:hypothetical protein SESBI_36905 [Sesbania bispinosa]|nr:hypothetical protein SESBI_36905 [Sesbania bispinosa]
MENSPAKPIFGLEKGTCPPGTVPIRRTTKDEIIRVKSLLNNHILDQDNLDSHVAQVTMLKDGGPYYGVSGATSIYNPRCGNDQTSAAHIWAQNGQDDGTNKITVGWHSDNFKKTGCYNVLSPGFVQTDTEYYIGSPVAKTSVYGGEMVQLSVSLLQDENTKNWFVYMVNRTVGYFPAALFSNMAIADQVGWGGRTTTPTGTPNPTMGSGYFPDDNFVHACYFVNVAYQNASRKYYGPETYWAESFTDVPKCYGVEYYGDQGRQVGYSLQFGGPGGDCTN